MRTSRLTGGIDMSTLKLSAGWLLPRCWRITGDGPCRGECQAQAKSGNCLLVVPGICSYVEVASFRSPGLGSNPCRTFTNCSVSSSIVRHKETSAFRLSCQECAPTQVIRFSCILPLSFAILSYLTASVLSSAVQHHLQWRSKAVHCNTSASLGRAGECK